MPLDHRSVGAKTRPAPTHVDSRWLMAYAAGLGETHACYFDTRRKGGIVAHPLFPVCFEWPVFLELHGHPGRAALTREDRLRGVHATHELTWHAPLRAGSDLITTAQVESLEARKPGGFEVVRLETRDAQGTLVCTTRYGSLYRGVSVLGEAASRVSAAAVSPADEEIAQCSVIRRESIDFAPQAAHVYTECSRIWNPIHTDAAVAEQAGLPGILLHGTATLAHALSRIVAAFAADDPLRVQRVTAEFRAPVFLPARVELIAGSRELSDGTRRVAFEVRGASGEQVLRRGTALLGDPLIG